MTLREVVLSAALPRPRAGLPALGETDLAAFFARFDEAAPLHLKAGLLAAVAVLGAALPRLWGYGATMLSLDEEQREQVIARAAGVAALGPLLDVVKVVACLAYFRGPQVEAAFRGRG